MKMKLNMYNIKKCFMKHKYFILYVILLTLFFVFLLPRFREGLANASIGEYSYLAPIPSGNTWDQSTMDKFAKKYNEVNNKTGGQMLDGNSKSLQGYISSSLSVEVDYFIDNGKWPYCGYVSTYVEKHPEALSPFHDSSGNVMTPTSLQKMWPNRVAYQQLISKTEKNITPPPVSYKIFMGTANLPSNSSSPSSSPATSSSSLSSSSPSTSSLSDTNYQQLMSLCKNIMGNQK
uniref:Uncharacterized protein n=1 Tax=viral metagenome TaxID=1070528 RepID=A0A6C0B0S7_9ZZZZ